MCNFRTLTASDTECRVQSIGKNKNGEGAWASLLLYKNARIDRAILDETCGKFGWQSKYELIDGKLFCSISIKSPDGEWISKQDVGTESNTEKEKGQASDALKRAAFAWGIGVELYTGPKIFVQLGAGEYQENNGKVYSRVSFGVTQMDVDEATRRITALVICTNPDRPESQRRECFRWTSKPVLTDKLIDKLSSRIASGEDLTEMIRSTYFVTANQWQTIMSRVASLVNAAEQAKKAPKSQAQQAAQPQTNQIQNNQ